MRFISLTRVMVGLIGGSLSPALADPCDRSLAPSPVAIGATGYVQRAGGERCEGIYVSPVSGTPVELVSLTRGHLNFDPSHPGVLSVTLDQPPPSGAAHLRAVGIPSGLYYRMDADITGDHPVTWPVGDVLVKRNLAPDQIGIFAYRQDASADRTYLVVDVAPAGTAPPPDQPVTTVLRVVDVTDLKWRFTRAHEKAADSYALVPVHGDHAEVSLANADGPVNGTLEVRWSDPGSGKSRGTTFRIGD